jgi:hypothetical protein
VALKAIKAHLVQQVLKVQQVLLLVFLAQRVQQEYEVQRVPQEQQAQPVQVVWVEALVLRVQQD